jgi:hypothetical protein
MAHCFFNWPSTIVGNMQSFPHLDLTVLVVKSDSYNIDKRFLSANIKRERNGVGIINTNPIYYNASFRKLQ